MTAVRSTETRPASEQGFALILAVLALMLLTFLGLALATSTSSELQIATNYRWGLQALYNAEAGQEAARRILRDPAWSDVLPVSRAGSWNITASPAPAPPTSLGPIYTSNPATQDQWTNPLRQWEANPCDKLGHGMGYGSVLNDGTNVYQYTTTLFGKQLAGAVTIWVRRPLVFGDGTAQDQPENHNVLVTVEGVAPFLGTNLGSAGGTPGQAVMNALNRSVLATKVLEWTDNDGQTSDSGDGTCNRREGQVGSGAEGSGFGGCEAVTATGVQRGLEQSLGAGNTVSDSGQQ